VLALDGPSGAGKSTAAAGVAAALGAELLPEAYRRLRPRPSLAFRSDGELARLEAELLEGEARRYLRAGSWGGPGPVVADTGFLGPLTYTWALVRSGRAGASVLPPLVARAAAMARTGRWGLPDLTVYLATPARERSRRVALDPVGHPPDVAGRHEAVGRLEWTLYRRRIGPVLGRRFRVVDGGGAPEAVVRRLLGEIRRPPRGPPPSFPDALAVLATLDGPA